MQWFWESKAWEVGLMFAFMACTISLQYDYLESPNYANQWTVLLCFGLSVWAMVVNIKDLTGDFDALH